MKPIYAKPPLGSHSVFQVRKDYLERLDTKWHYHSEYELAYVYYPHGKRIAGNSIASFEKDDLVLYGPNLPHAWLEMDKPEEAPAPGSNTGLLYHAIVVHFNSDCLGEGFFSIPEMGAVLDVLKKSTRGIVVSGNSRSRISVWMKELLEETGARRVILLLQILEELAGSKEYLLLSATGYWDNLNDHDAERMSTIYEYILQHFTQEISLNTIAAQAHISPAAFCRYFKARTKRTLKEFVNELRINYACQLLEENTRSISQICFEVGFNNISNFNRRFKEMKGVTPQQYKASIIGFYHANCLLGSKHKQRYV